MGAAVAALARVAVVAAPAVAAVDKAEAAVPGAAAAAPLNSDCPLSPGKTDIHLDSLGPVERRGSLFMDRVSSVFR